MRKWDFYTSTEIKPRGWLKKQLQLQAEGLCGNLDKVWPDVRDSAWIGGTAEGWERVPYWLDGFIPMAYLLEDTDLIARGKKYIDAILAAQREDGWICPCGDAERKEYDTWAVQLITKVLVTYYQCSKDERIPEAVYRALKNYYALLESGTVELFKWGKSRWYETFIAIDFTYRRYPEEWLLQLAKLLKKQGLNWRDCTEQWKRPLFWHRQETHIVNLTMMLKAEAVSCDLLGNAYTDEAEYLRSILQEYNGTAVSSFTGDECLGGLSPVHGTELCAIVEQMYSYELLYAYTGDRKWAEQLEILAFNALPAAISEDMWTHQYDQLSNQIACQTFPGKPPFTTNWTQAHLFGLEPHFGCCTANFGQGWPKFILSTFMHNANSVINVLPVPSRLETDAQAITLETNYPFENSLHYTIEAKKDFDFCVRIPSFAKNILADGKAVSGDVQIHLQAGQHRELKISFDVDTVMDQRPYDLQTVRRGSLVFALPVAYEKEMFEYERNGVERKYPYCDYELIPQSDWNYAFASQEMEVCSAPVGDVPFSEKTPPVYLKTKMNKIDWGFEEGYNTLCAKVPASRAPIAQEEEKILIPYGCAKLRMTEIPLIK